jgi:hypothetical protein
MWFTRYSPSPGTFRLSVVRPHKRRTCFDHSVLNTQFLYLAFYKLASLFTLISVSRISGSLFCHLRFAWTTWVVLVGCVVIPGSIEKFPGLDSRFWRIGSQIVSEGIVHYGWTALPDRSREFSLLK